jgi:hypothetical protein
MSLTLEDGTGKSDAQSFVSVADFEAYAALRGISDLPAAEADKEVMLIKASDYISSLRGRFQGYKTSQTQALQFPRSGASLDGYELASDSIPQVLIDAQCELALAVHAGKDLMPTNDGKVVISQKVGDLAKSFQPLGTVPKQEFTAALKLLEPLFAASGGVSSVRV